MKLTGTLFISVLLVAFSPFNNAFPSLIPPFYLNCVVAIGVIPPGSLDFNADEFNIQEKDSQQLCQTIKSDNYNLGEDTVDKSCINFLNRVLEVSNLFDQIISKQPNPILISNEITELDQQTAGNRKKPIKNLKIFDQNSIKRLNRLMIERIYTQKCPASTRWVGTGFLLGDFVEKLDDRQKRYNVFLVTNKHVLNDKKFITVRFNPQTNEPASSYDISLIDQQGKSKWTGHPKDAVDIGIITINAAWLREKKMTFDYFRSDENILTTDKMAEMGMTEGDSIFVLGYPMGIVGQDRQYVISRSGSIARIKDVLDKHGTQFIVDALVFPGNSGGPVITKPEIMSIEGTKSINVAYLIGIVQSYIPYREIAISQQTNRPRIVFEENSGLSAIIPADFIMETIEVYKKSAIH